MQDSLAAMVRKNETGDSRKYVPGRDLTVYPRTRDTISCRRTVPGTVFRVKLPRVAAKRGLEKSICSFRTTTGTSNRQKQMCLIPDGSAMQAKMKRLAIVSKQMSQQECAERCTDRSGETVERFFSANN